MNVLYGEYLREIIADYLNGDPAGVVYPPALAFKFQRNKLFLPAQS